MAQTTAISWCDHTFNPWWGCTRVSAGCDHCYADAFARRTGLQLWDGGPRRFFGQNYWDQPLRWNAAAAAAGVRRRVFCASMGDLFEAAPSAELDAPRERLWEIIDRTAALDWLLLTKRPENMQTLTPKAWADGWPCNVWALATAESADLAPHRVAHLMRMPAAVRGLSIEPMLDPIGLDAAALMDGWIDWVIVGCERLQGDRPGRPCELDWVRALANAAREAGVAVFVKQLEIGGRVSTDPADWPEDLRIQEFPAGE